MRIATRYLIITTSRATSARSTSPTAGGDGHCRRPRVRDEMTLQIRWTIRTALWTPSSRRSGAAARTQHSLATEWVKGKTIDEALTIKNTDIVKELSLPPVKIHCSVLAEDAIRAAIADIKRKKEGQAPQAAPSTQATA